MKRFLIIVLVMLLILSGTCYADGLDTHEVENAVPDDARELAGDLDDAGDAQAFFERMGDTVKQKFMDNAGGILKKAVSVVIVAVMCSILSLFGGDKTPELVTLCGCAAITMLCVSDTNSYISQSTKVINDISAFSKILLPAMCTASAACGEISSAAVRYAASAMFMDVFIALAQNLIVPFIYAYLAVSIASAAFDNPCLGSVSKLLKWASTSLMTLLSLGFTAYIGVSSAIASGGDKLASKIAKTTISTVLPVVGGIISDAASSVVAGAEIVKNTLGAFGMIVVLALCISPMVVIGLNYLAFKAAGAFTSTLKLPQIASLTHSIGTAFGMLLGLVGCCGVMMFMSLISCMRAVVG